MKKIISICMAAVLIVGATITAFADDYAGSGQTEIKTHIYSHYNITIPEVVDLSNGNFAEVSVSDADIENGYSVNVYVTNTDESNAIPLTHTDGLNTIHCSLINTELNTNANETTPLVTIDSNEINEGAASKSFEMQYENFGKAGDYIGIMEYRFECVNN